MIKLATCTERIQTALLYAGNNNENFITEKLSKLQYQ